MNDTIPLNLGDRNPICFSERDMTDEQACMLIDKLFHGDYALSNWQDDFVTDNLRTKHFSQPQKHVIYDMARHFKLI